MPDVNALYPQAPAPGSNLLTGDPSKVIGLVGALNQNALFQQQFNARKAIGDAYQSAIQPDGSIHTPTLMRAIKDRPEAAFMAGEASAGALTREGQQIANTTALFEQHAKQNQFVVNGLGTLADKPNLTMDDVRSFGVTLARNTGIPSTMLTSWLAQLPRDPKKLRESVVTLRNAAIGSAGLATPTTAGITPEGAPLTATQGQFNYRAAPGETSPPAAGTAPVAAAPPAAAPRGVQTALSPAAAAAASATGGAAGSTLAHARENSIGYQRQVFPLEQAISALEKLGPNGTGPGADTVNHIKSFLLTAGVPGVDANKIASFDEAKKYLTDFVNQTGNSGTNDKLAAAFAGNPSVHISNAAAKDVAKAALALRRADEARLQAFEKAGVPESDHAKFAGKWNREHDVRVYGWDMMTPDQRKAVLKDMPQAKRDLFMLDVDEAEQGGTIRPPRLLPVPTKKK